MEQIRLYSEVQGPVAKEYFKQLNQTFEEDGLPISIVELCEASDLHEISLYTNKADQAATKAIMFELQAKLNIPQNIQEEQLPDIDWVKHALKGLAPVETDQFFIYGQHDKDKIPRHKLAIEIEANQAFGTGHHATTVDCLKLLEYAIPKLAPKSLLDIGTGSGILSIAAAKLAEKLTIPLRITASDIDPIAVKVAQENIVLNQVAEYITIYLAEEEKAIEAEAPFEIIVANILAGPLIELAPKIHKFMAPNGVLILSGILQSQAEKVTQAYNALGFNLQKTMLSAEWSSLYLTASAN